MDIKLLKLNTEEAGTIYIDELHPSFSTLRALGNIEVVEVLDIEELTSDTPEVVELQPTFLAPTVEEEVKNEVFSTSLFPYSASGDERDSATPDWVKETDVIPTIYRNFLNGFDSYADYTQDIEYAFGKAWSQLKSQEGNVYIESITCNDVRF